MTSLKFKLQNYWSSWYFTLMMCKSSWKLISTHIFVPNDHTWISKLLRDAAFSWQPSWLKSELLRVLFWGIRLSEQFLYWKKFYYVLDFLRDKFKLLLQNSVTDVSVGFRPPCWCPSGWAPTWCVHTNLYNSGEKASPHILHKKNCCDLNLGESVCTLLNGFDFDFYLF